MIKVGLFGLTGDPVTLGHKLIGQYVQSSCLVNEFWYQPCWKHRFGKQPVDPVHRLNMCQLVCNEILRCRTSAFEIDNRLECGTYEILSLMRENFNVEFFPVIGMDNANHIQKWSYWEKLITEFPFIVVPRLGVEMKTDWFLKPPHKFVDVDIDIAVSSTFVKELLDNNKHHRVQELLTPRVYEYIVENKVY